MAYGLISDERRGKAHLESMGLDINRVQNLSCEEKAVNLCKAFRASSHQHMRPYYAFWTAGWIAFGLHTAVFDNKDLEKYAAAGFGTAWGVGTMVQGRRKQKELETEIITSFSTPCQG